MDWLSGWLKSIVLIILLATFVDILLPSQTMQRYVKTVIGLFILLILLQPLFSIFQKEGSINEQLAKAMRQSSSSGLNLFASDAKQANSATMQSLSTIQQQAEQLKNRQEEQSLKLMQQQMSTLMKKTIEQQAEVKVQQIQVETVKDDQGQMVISHVFIKAAPQHPAKSSPSGEGKQNAVTVKPIQPVDIRIAPQSKADEADKAAGAPASAGFEKEQTQIRMLLLQEWQVPLDRVTVDMISGQIKS